MGNEYEERFVLTIKFGKFALLALLLIGGFVNGHKSYIQKNPRKFMWDSFAVGGLSAVAIVIIAMMRGRPDLAVNLAFVSFFLFFAYNVFRELSGFNDVFEKDKLTQGEAKQARALKWPILGIFLAGSAILMYMAYKASVPHPTGRGSLFLEAAILGAFTAAAEMTVARNHGVHFDGILVGGIANFILFFVAHLVLQWGGFYSHLFNPAPPCIY